MRGHASARASGARRGRPTMAGGLRAGKFLVAARTRNRSPHFGPGRIRVYVVGRPMATITNQSSGPGPAPSGRPAGQIRMRSISKSYGGTVANRDVDFDVFPGEIHALLGENGAG